MPLRSVPDPGLAAKLRHPPPCLRVSGAPGRVINSTRYGLVHSVPQAVQLGLRRGKADRASASRKETIPCIPPAASQSNSIFMVIRAGSLSGMVLVDARRGGRAGTSMGGDVRER